MVNLGTTRIILRKRWSRYGPPVVEWSARRKLSWAHGSRFGFVFVRPNDNPHVIARRVAMAAKFAEVTMLTRRTLPSLGGSDDLEFTIGGTTVIWRLGGRTGSFARKRIENPSVLASMLVAAAYS